MRTVRYVVYLAAMALLIALPLCRPACGQATLSYSYGAANSSYHFRPLIITAANGGANVWKMTLWVPWDGSQFTDSDVAAPGEIAEFRDLAHGGAAFNYSPEGGAMSWSPGLLRISGFQGAYLDGSDAGHHEGQTPGYYEFTKTHVVSGLTYRLTCRINAPVVAGSDYQTFIDATHTVTNNSAANVNLWGSGEYAGSGSLSLSTGGYTNWPILNPTAATAKPNVHNTDAVDGHQLYTIYDWYGSTVTSLYPGFYAKLVVKDNPETLALNMRPGLTFELRADNIDYYYVNMSNYLKGSTFVSAADGLRLGLSNQAGVFGNGAVLEPGQSRTINWQGIISTLPTPIPPVARAGVDLEVIDADDNGLETVTLDGTASLDPDGALVDYAWTENGQPLAGGPSPAVVLAVGLHTITLTVTDSDAATSSDTVTISVRGHDGYTYYVDYDGGSDAANGRTAAAAWKHCPGDAAAGGVPAATALQAGDRVIFKGGAHYRGLVRANWSGLANTPIVYDGNTAGTFGTGRAIIDGSELLTGWVQCQSAEEAGGNPEWANLWYTYLPAGVTTFSANLYEDDQLLWIAQDPNLSDPFWHDDISDFVYFDAASATTITDTAYFTQDEATAWDGQTYVLIYASPALIYTKAVTGYDPVADQIQFEPLGGGGHYPVGQGKFAMCNSLRVLDRPGEYVVREDQAVGGQAKVYLWPRTPETAGKAITVSTRVNCLYLGSSSYLTIQGFELVKASGGLNQSGGLGSAIRNGGGIVHDITIRDNLLTRNRSMERQPVIDLWDIDNCVIEGNQLVENQVSRGIILDYCTNTSIRNNYLRKNGGTGIDYYHSHHSEIVGNTVLDHLGMHANGLTVYLFSSDILIQGNVVLGGNCALTVQQSQDLTVAYNVLQTDYAVYCVADWGATTNVHYYNNTIRNVGNPGSGLSIADSSTGSVLRNNIIDGTNAGYVNSAGKGNDATHAYNLYTSTMWCQSAPWQLGPGEFVNRNFATLFADDANGDFRLKTGSPAINAGTDLGWAADLLGTPVPQGAAPDLGAYEYAEVPQLAAGLSRTWVYQNTPLTTGLRHHSLLTLTVGGATQYSVTVAKQDGPGEVVIEGTASPLLWIVRGGQRSNGAAGVGAVTLLVTVTPVSGPAATATVELTVRALGDINGAGGVSGQDKLQMNKRLNGLLPDGPEYDLDGIGGASGQDKLILNKILNGLALP